VLSNLPRGVARTTSLFQYDNRMRIHQPIPNRHKKKRSSVASTVDFRDLKIKNLIPNKASSRGFAKVLTLLVVAIIAGAAGVLFALQTQPDKSASLDAVQAQLGNTIVLPADFKQIPEFALLDKEGASVDSSFLEGQWSMLFFGFTHCPDVCPTTLSTAAKAVKQIKAQTADDSIPVPKVVFVSVDPKRDTPESLKNYVEFFNADFNALTGTVNQMFELVTPLNGIVNYTVDENNPDEYTVDHTASIMLVDPELRLRAKFNAPHKAEEIANDYQTILSQLATSS